MKRWKIINLLLVALVLCTSAGPVLADDTGPVGPGKSLGDGSPQTILLHLSVGSFDPLASTPEEMLDGVTSGEAHSALLKNLLNTAEQAQSDGAYLLQFTGPVREEWKQVLESLGVQIGPYVPDFTFIVQMDEAAYEKAASLSFVRWIGPYQPAYRISEYAWEQTRRSFRVLLLPWAAAESAAWSQALPDANPQAYAEDALLVELDQASLLQAARQPGVLWIEPLFLNELQSTSQSGLQNNVAGTILNAGIAWAANLNGTGIKVGVADTGLDTGNLGTLHGDFSGRVTNVVSYPVQVADYGGGCVTSYADDGWSDKETGHGTHVAGSLAGSGTRSAGQFKGMAYNASLAFQAVEQYTNWPSACPLYDGYYLTGIPANPGTLLLEAYNWGVRVHNNSWGTAAYKGYYDSQARSFDDVTSQHRDLLVVVAAGNEGTDANDDGYADADSVIAPSTAKNVLTVGAVDNDRTSGGLALDEWSDYWLADFQFPPTSIDQISDDPQEMAAFSGRGPTDDGRIKPDLVAPGTDIVSTRSSLATGTGWGVYDSYYLYNGGTSMASPLAAGAAALVRDYYIDKLGVANPSAALIKATLINSAVDIYGYGNLTKEAGLPIPNMHEGWGRIDVGAAVTTGNRKFTDNTAGLSTSGKQEYTYYIQTGKPFKVTLVWSDVEANAGAAVTLVNDLDLEVVAPNGVTLYRGNVFSGGWSQTGGTADRRNNVENVYIQSPVGGQWKITVKGYNVPYPTQPYALVVSGNVLPANPPDITGFKPGRAANNAVLVGAAINGTYLESAQQVKLMKGAETINGSIYLASPTQVVADFNLTGATPGWWDVMLTSLTGSDTLSQKIEVLDATLPDLTAQVESDDVVVSPGDLVNYTVTLENVSQLSASSVIFTDTLPAGMAFDSINPACDGNITAAYFTCEVGTLASGATKIYEVVLEVQPGASGLQVNQVEVGSAQPERWANDNSDSEYVVVNGRLVYLPLVFRGYKPGNPVGNPGFESGDNGVWAWSSVLGIAPISPPPAGYSAHSGAMIGWLGGVDNQEHVETENWLQQSVVIPTGMDTLQYWYWIVATENCDLTDQVVVLLDGNQVNQHTLCSGTNSVSWVQATVPVADFQGQTVKLWFYLTQDTEYPSSFLLDDLEIK